jgi:hypothetical protein
MDHSVTPVDMDLKRYMKQAKSEYLFISNKRELMRRGVDSFLPSSWEPQEEGMMSTAASFSLRKKPRLSNPGKSQYSRR